MKQGPDQEKDTDATSYRGLYGDESWQMKQGILQMPETPIDSRRGLTDDGDAMESRRDATAAL